MRVPEEGSHCHGLLPEIFSSPGHTITFPVGSICACTGKKGRFGPNDHLPTSVWAATSSIAPKLKTIRNKIAALTMKLRCVIRRLCSISKLNSKQFQLIKIQKVANDSVSD